MNRQAARHPVRDAHTRAPGRRRRAKRLVERTLAALTAGGLVAASFVAATSSATASEQEVPPPPITRSLTSTDNLDGTFANPLLKSDVPDVSVISVPGEDVGEDRDVYYMVSTTMHMAPGAPIMKSYDLVNWETATYTYDILQTTDSNALRNNVSAYGRGQWATSLRYHDGTYYVSFNSNNNNKAFLFMTDDLEHGTWEKREFNRAFHDMSLFFDDANGGTPYVLWGYNSINIARLSPDLRTVEQEWPNMIVKSDYPTAVQNDVIGNGFEGTAVYFINGHYYIMTITFGPSGRQQILFRDDQLLGKFGTDATPYETKLMLRSNGIAQGGLVDVVNDDETVDSYAMLFRDSYPLGRIPVLVPVEWDEDPAAWPKFGNENGQVLLPGSLAVPVELTERERRREALRSIVASDDFENDAASRAYDTSLHSATYADEWTPNGSNLDLAWQWNHSPDNRYWSLTDREGWLRLETGRVMTGTGLHPRGNAPFTLTYFEEARNTLTQRTWGPKASAETKVDISGMKDGDVAGLAAFTRQFAYIGVKDVAGQRTLGVVRRTSPFTADVSNAEPFVSGATVALPANQTEVHVKIDLNYSQMSSSNASFYYSLDGQQWTKLGNTVSLPHELTHFMGYRFGLFNYATKSTGGHVDFDHYLLSGTLTADNAPLNRSGLDASIAYAQSLEASDYTAESWTAVHKTLLKAAAVSSASTQNQIDAPANDLAVALASLIDAEPAPELDVTAETSARCVAGKVTPTIRVTNNDDVTVSLVVESVWGVKTSANLAPGKSVLHAFTSRATSVPAGSYTVEATGPLGGETVTTVREAAYPAHGCN